MGVHCLTKYKTLITLHTHLCVVGRVFTGNSQGLLDIRGAVCDSGSEPISINSAHADV